MEQKLTYFLSSDWTKLVIVQPKFSRVTNDIYLK